jgi:hypothetical protein
MDVKEFKDLLESFPESSFLFSENYDYGQRTLNFASPEYFSVEEKGATTIKDLKEKLHHYPDDLRVLVEMQSLEPEDQGKLPVASIGINAQVNGEHLSGHKVVIELKSPYM